MLELFLRSIWHKSLSRCMGSLSLALVGLSGELFVSLIRSIVALVCFVTRLDLLPAFRRAPGEYFRGKQNVN